MDATEHEKAAAVLRQFFLFVDAFGFSLLSEWFACKASEPLRSKKPPAMRVETNRLTKKSPFRTIEVSKPLLRKER